MKSIWYPADIYVLDDVVAGHTGYSISELEVIDSIMNGDSKIGFRKHRETGVLQLIVMTRGNRWNGDEVGIISREYEGWSIEDKIEVFHAYHINYQFEEDWRSMICR